MEARNLYFSYDEQPFIEGLEIKLQEGKITTILGPNGSGKSTLLNLFANQYTQQSGSIYLEQRDIREMKGKEIAQKLAVVYQQNLAPSDLTVEKLVGYGRMPHKKLWQSIEESDEEIIDWALTVTNLTELRHKKLISLSGGERQRAWIAMALAQKTKILFLDEPTTYLDIYYQLEILELVKELNRKWGLTVVMVLHDINQAIQYSDEIIVMKKGAVVVRGPVEEIITEALIEKVYGIHAIKRWCPINKCPYITPIPIKENE